MIEYEVEKLEDTRSELAPREWWGLPEVQKIAPKFDSKKYHERALYKISDCNLNICFWMYKSSAYWYKVSDLITIKELQNE